MHLDHGHDIQAPRDILYDISHICMMFMQYLIVLLLLYSGRKTVVSQYKVVRMTEI